MNRYQVYLDPNTVNVLDQFEKVSNISRSQLIRSAVDRLAKNLVHFVINQTPPTSLTPQLDTLVGSIQTAPTDKKTAFARTSDRDYLRD